MSNDHEKLYEEVEGIKKRLDLGAKKFDKISSENRDNRIIQIIILLVGMSSLSYEMVK